MWFVWFWVFVNSVVTVIVFGYGLVFSDSVLDAVIVELIVWVLVLFYVWVT